VIILANEDNNTAKTNIVDEKNQEEKVDLAEQSDVEDNIMDDADTVSDIDLVSELKKKDEEIKYYIDIAQRVKAEFENYKKRINREREQLYTDITAEVIARFLPVLDNLERAASVECTSEDGKAYAEGVNMVLKQFKEVMSKAGVEEIPAMDEQFDPNFHNAVMHVEDDDYGPNTVIEVLQKGYKLKDKVLRYSMVKVAN